MPQKTVVIIGGPTASGKTGVAINLAQRLGIALETLEPDRVVLRMAFRPDNVTVGAIVHGGAIATLVDIAGAAASASGAHVKVVLRA